MTVTLARMEDMSLQHWIKEAILPLKWVERVTNVPLNYNSEKGRFEAEIRWLPNFLDEGRGWVYFDVVSTTECVTTAIPTVEQLTRVTVYNESSAVISDSNYTISYTDGAIIAVGGMTTPQGVPTTVDFTQYYVSVVDGWPGTEPPAPPIVAIELGPYTKEGFQLGGGRKAIRTGTFHIFATSSAERDDLTEFLYDAIYNRHIPVIDYRGGEPLNYDGTFNDSYVGDLLQLNNNDEAIFNFCDVKAEPINLRRSDVNDLNRFRSRVTFTMESYRDGIDFMALG